LGTASPEAEGPARESRSLQFAHKLERDLSVFQENQNADSKTAAWALQQLRETIPCDHEYRFIIHDHDAIFCARIWSFE